MKRTSLIASLVLAAAFASRSANTYGPGSRIQILSHNAYPDHGKYADRLDRSLAAGLPAVIEQDLAWIDGRSLMIHGAKNATADDPTLESYFFPKVQPIVEKALKEGNKGNWPLVTLYLDIKNDPPEHLEVISKTLEKYDSWLTSAVKTTDIAKQSPAHALQRLRVVFGPEPQRIADLRKIQTELSRPHHPGLPPRRDSRTARAAPTGRSAVSNGAVGSEGSPCQLRTQPEQGCSRCHS